MHSSKRAIIASGTGRYADPWHPFPRTSALIAEVLADVGFDTEVVDDLDVAMTRLSDVDVLVVNAGDPWRSGEGQAPPRESIDGFAQALERGIGVIAVHCAVSTMRDYPEWAAATGAMWVPTLSFHPPADEAQIVGCRNSAGISVDAFRVFDERYCRLQRIGRSVVVAEHEGPEGREPTAWVRTLGRSRVAVDLLGHDERSYESAGRRALLSRLAEWVADREGVTSDSA
jgi:type 1 glutamine amidotransferase